jgi:hypothetical protein
MLEGTDAITNEVLKPITFVLAYTTVFKFEVMEKYLYADVHNNGRNTFLKNNNM